MGSPLRDLNILVTGAGAPGFPGITKSLRMNGERNVKIIGTDMKDDVVGFHLTDRHYVVPSGLDQTYIDAIIEIIQKENTDIILPLCTFELLPLSKPALIIANKMDLPTAEENLEHLMEYYIQGLVAACSAEAELALRRAEKIGFLKYAPGQEKFKIKEGAELTPEQFRALEYIEKRVMAK